MVEDVTRVRCPVEVFPDVYYNTSARYTCQKSKVHSVKIIEVSASVEWNISSSLK